MEGIECSEMVSNSGCCVTPEETYLEQTPPNSITGVHLTDHEISVIYLEAE